MTTKPRREELIAQIRAAYARPRQGKTDRLETMEIPALQTLHGRLTRLAERTDLQGHPTPATIVRRMEARSRLKAALDQLKALHEARASRTPKARPSGPRHS